MTRLLIVRHGETEWNRQGRYIGHQDIGLNAIGREQAEALARRLADRSIDAVYTSDLRRASETAEIVSRAVDLAARPDPQLRELSFGQIEGMAFDEAQKRYPEQIASWLHDRDKPPFGGERYSTFSERVASFLDMVKVKHPDQTILIVSHAGPIREILRLALGLPPEGHWYFKVDNASLSEIMLHEEGPVLVRLNDVQHPKKVSDGS